MKKFIKKHRWIKVVVILFVILLLLFLAALLFLKLWPAFGGRASAEDRQSLGAKAAMPIHWGAFALANHPWDDSVERFVAVGEQAGLQIVTPQIGETMNLNSMESSMERWWKDIL